MLTLTLIELSGQYDYFQTIEGAYGDTSASTTSSVECTPEGYVSWGLYSTPDYNHVYLYKYNFDGVRIDSNAFVYPDEFVYIGKCNNFQFSTENERLIYFAGLIGDDNPGEGYFIEFSLELDSIFTRRYTPFERQYIRGFSIVEGGYLLLGSHGTLNSFDGSFLAKVDLNGNYEWIEVMNSPELGVNYGNRYSGESEVGYLIAGYRTDNNLISGVLTLTNFDGETLLEVPYKDETYDRWSMLGLAKLESEEYMIIQSLGYEEFPNDLNFDYYWKNIKLAKINQSTGEETWSQIYHEDYTLANGDWLDIEPTPDGGVIVLGWAYEPDYLYYNWMMKVDANGNEEWFKTYTAEECTGCLNFLQDIEVAPDGGYIGAGYFEYWEVDDLRNSWILKVDACGDVEWQGCEPLGTTERQTANFTIYPNPSSGKFTLESDDLITAYRIIDLSGRVIDQKEEEYPLSKAILKVKVPAGIYLVEVHTASGKVGRRKLQINQ